MSNPTRRISGLVHAIMARQMVESERTRCAQICKELAESYDKMRVAANECGYRNLAFEYTIAVKIATDCEKLIRGEK